MREIVFEDDFFIGDRRRIVLKLLKVKKSDNFPTGLEFAVQYLYFKNDEWRQIARIDNQLHEGKAGTHIHILRREKVEHVDIDFNEAREKIIELGEGVIKNIFDKI